MIEWKQVDSLPDSIPVDWYPSVYLEKSVGSQLFRLRLTSREPAFDFILRIKRGSLKRIKYNIQYQDLVPIAEDLKAIAEKLGFTPISDQKKIKSGREGVADWYRTPVPSCLNF